MGHIHWTISQTVMPPFASAPVRGPGPTKEPDPVPALRGPPAQGRRSNTQTSEILGERAGRRSIQGGGL